MQEIRKIVFSNDELLSAFGSYSRKTVGFLPAGKLLSCAPANRADTGAEVKVKVETMLDGASKVVELSYRNADVLHPLILFCLENNIMLPRDGRKAFLVLEGQACLIVDLNLEFDLGMQEASMTSEDIDKVKGS